MRIKINGLNDCYIIWLSFLGTNLRQRRLKGREFVTEIARNVDRITEDFSTAWWVKGLNKIGILKDVLHLHQGFNCTLHCNAKVKRENRDAPSFKKKCVC